MLVDTIGFAFDLNPFIIDSFDLTLMDIKNSDLILLVIDASDGLRMLEEKIKANLEILELLQIDKKILQPVLNKVDLVDKADLVEKLNLVNSFF